MVSGACMVISTCSFCPDNAFPLSCHQPMIACAPAGNSGPVAPKGFLASSPIAALYDQGVGPFPAPTDPRTGPFDIGTHRGIPPSRHLIRPPKHPSPLAGKAAHLVHRCPYIRVS